MLRENFLKSSDYCEEFVNRYVFRKWLVVYTQCVTSFTTCVFLLLSKTRSSWVSYDPLYPFMTNVTFHCSSYVSPCILNEALPSSQSIESGVSTGMRVNRLLLCLIEVQWVICGFVLNLDPEDYTLSYL